MLTSRSQGFAAYYIHGSLIILPTPLKNPQKVRAQEHQKYLVTFYNHVHQDKSTLSNPLLSYELTRCTCD